MEAEQKRVMIIHGRNGEVNAGWRGWLARELKDRGFEVVQPQMPGGDHPKPFEWMKAISEAVGIPDEKTFFVAHSLGCIAVVRYLEQLPLETKVGGCVFVGGFSKDIGLREIAAFTAERVDFEKVTIHAKQFVTIISRNDDRVPLDVAMDFQRRLGAEPIIETAGHFRESDGVIYLEPALQNILKMAN